jgi:hypothetical protein
MASSIKLSFEGRLTQIIIFVTTWREDQLAWLETARLDVHDSKYLAKISWIYRGEDLKW